MPALHVQNPGVAAVARFGLLLDQFLAEAAVVKSTATIEPTLKKSDFKDIASRLRACFSSDATTGENGEGEVPSLHEQEKAKQFAIIETASRDLFGNLIVSNPSPAGRHYSYRR